MPADVSIVNFQSAYTDNLWLGILLRVGVLSTRRQIPNVDVGMLALVHNFQFYIVLHRLLVCPIWGGLLITNF